ncbi:sulfotransferase [Actinomadura vinacea]|uniref:Sulfotransferase n=1 Tax=Actinomadura vinacea TaxID=115336 RepID=A0ABP5VQU1_9ACTN
MIVSELPMNPSVQDVLAAAERAAGLDDHGGDGFRESLGGVVRLLNEDADLPAERRAAAFGQLVEVLAGRLRLVEDDRRHPGIGREEVTAPLIVIGFGRSGTTFLHSIIAADPDNRAPAYWEVARPSPPPGLAAADDPRIALGDRDIESWLADLPGFITQHPYWDQGGSALMECEGFLVYDLRNHYPIQLSKIPYGTSWVADRDDDVVRYEFHRWFLKHLQYGAPPRRWALKGVDHQFHLAGLRAVYPDARLVWAHRDPVQVCGSLLAVISMLIRGTGKMGDPAEFARAWLDRQGELVDGILADPFAADPAICHVRYPDLVSDPVGTVRGVYDHFGLPVTAEFERRARAWLDAPENRPDRHGKWTYALAEYGLDEDDIDARFAGYRERFGV